MLIVTSVQLGPKPLGLRGQALLDLGQVLLQQTGGSAVGPLAGIGSLLVLVHAGGQGGVEGLVVVSVVAHQLLVDVLHVETALDVEQAPLGEDALDVALGLGVVGVLPLLVLLHQIHGHGQLLDALIAVGQHVVSVLHHIVGGGL